MWKLDKKLRQIATLFYSWTIIQWPTYSTTIHSFLSEWWWWMNEKWYKTTSNQQQGIIPVVFSPRRVKQSPRGCRVVVLLATPLWHIFLQCHPVYYSSSSSAHNSNYVGQWLRKAAAPSPSHTIRSEAVVDWHEFHPKAGKWETVSEIIAMRHCFEQHEGTVQGKEEKKRGKKLVPLVSTYCNSFAVSQ